MTPPAAKRIGKYPVIRLIGKGAMGTVYEGFDPDSGEKVAIKVLRAEHLQDESADSARARFVREAQALQRLRHPNIVRVHEYGEQGRIRFIAMEFIEGRELRQLMRERGRFTLDDAVFVMLQLLEALAHSHEQGIVHRDIKPTNVMVTEGLQIKVMDFGIARIESAAFTQMGTLLGTPSYMSPEQMRGEPVDGRADLWAAAVMIYEMLAGTGPFAPALSLATTQGGGCAMQAAPLSATVSGAPPALDALLQRALTPHTQSRWQTAADFARELTQVAAGAGTVAVDLAVEPDVDLPL